MRKRIQGLVLTGAALLVAGCATSGRNYQTDIDALNARVTALQGQLAEKDQEMAALKNQADDQRMAREAAEAALRNAQNEKEALLKSAKSASAPVTDLK